MGNFIWNFPMIYLIRNFIRNLIWNFIYYMTNFIWDLNIPWNFIWNFVRNFKWKFHMNFSFIWESSDFIRKFIWKETYNFIWNFLGNISWEISYEWAFCSVVGMWCHSCIMGWRGFGFNIRFQLELTLHKAVSIKSNDILIQWFIPAKHHGRIILLSVKQLCKKTSQDAHLPHRSLVDFWNPGGVKTISSKIHLFF